VQVRQFLQVPVATWRRMSLRCRESHSVSFRARGLREASSADPDSLGESSVTSSSHGVSVASPRQSELPPVNELSRSRNGHSAATREKMARPSYSAII
jgi:hypothetical protein